MSEVTINPERLNQFIELFNEKQGDYIKIVDELEEYVEDFTKNSDIGYKHLVSCMSELEDELDTNAEKTEDHLKELKFAGEEKGHSEDGKLGAIISNSRQHLDDISKYLSGMQGTDQKIFAEIKTHISKVNDVKNSIQSVEELSTDIEILAFNAMIVAAKAGEEGLAFSCITDELKNISNQTLIIVNDLMGLEKNLFTHYNLFQDSITVIEDKHKSTRGYLEEDIESTFTGFTFSIDMLSDIASDIITHFKTISPSFRDISKIISVKKEIPESIHIVHEGLEIIERNKKDLESKTEYDTTCLLQLLIGQSKISHYCQLLFNDINKHLDLSLGLVKDKLVNIDDKAHDIKSNQAVLKEYFTSNSSSFGTNSIDLIFQDTISGVNHISKLISETMDDKRQISDSGLSLIARIEELEEKFAVLTKTAKKFNLINISSKIEIAKRKVLSNHGNISDKIEEITEEIGKTLYATYDQLVLIKKSTQHLLGQYNTNMDVQIKKADFILGNMKNTLSDFGDSQEAINTTFSSIDIVTPKFLSLVTESKDDISEIWKLTEYAAHIAKLFGSIHNLVNDSKNQLLEMTSFTEDEVPTPHYDRIFKKIDQIENIYGEFSNTHSPN